MDEDSDISTEEFWKNAGDDLVRQEKYEMAIESYKQALAINANYGKAWNNLGYVYSKLGRKEEAKKCREKIDEIKPPVSEKPQPSQSSLSFGTIPSGPKQSILRVIPGFRSGTLWKMVLAVIGYGVIIVFIAAIISILLIPPSDTYPPQSTTNFFQNFYTPTVTKNQPQSTVTPHPNEVTEFIIYLEKEESVPEGAG